MLRTRLSTALFLSATVVGLTAACTTSGTPTAAPVTPSRAASSAPTAAPPASGAPASSASGTPGMPSADKVLSVVKAAAEQASAVHVKGNIVDSGSKITLDVQMNKDGSASGTIGQDGETFNLIIANGVDYVQFTKDLLTAGGLDATTQPGSLLLNKWASSKSKLLAGSDMTDTFKEVSYKSFVSSVFSDIAGETAKASGTTTVDGVPVVIYQAQDGTAYVATSSPHYLIRMVEAPADGNGRVDFTGWDKPVRIDPPPASEIYSGPGS